MVLEINYPLATIFIIPYKNNEKLTVNMYWFIEIQNSINELYDQTKKYRNIIFKQRVHPSQVVKYLTV